MIAGSVCALLVQVLSNIVIREGSVPRRDVPWSEVEERIGFVLDLVDIEEWRDAPVAAHPPASDSLPPAPGPSRAG